MQPLPKSPNGRPEQTVLRLLVRNHPGAMSHVCGLFARRTFNLEAILCVPVADGTHSAILLRVLEEDRLGQLVRQLRKLEDVIAIERDASAAAAFTAVERTLAAAATTPLAPA